MKMIRPVLLACAVVLAFILAFLMVRLGTGDFYVKERRESLNSLAVLRDRIAHYHETVGQFPSSLAQMEASFADNPRERRRPSKEHISSPDGNGRESAVLDGSGGWYYNRETGEVRINLDKRLKDYFKHYYRLDRNERPCDW